MNYAGIARVSLIRRFWPPIWSMIDRPFSAAADRNAEPILEILRHEFRDISKVLEIGSGTGQHATRFAAELDYLQWQTSDLEVNLDGIRSCVADAGLENVHAPIFLDVMTADVPELYDAVYSSNTAHIMSLEAVAKMFRFVSLTLRPGGVFCLYGPFRRFGRFNSESNARFDSSLRCRDPLMGIRDLEALDELAAEHAMRRSNLYAVPSNNLVSIWKRIHKSQK